MEVGERPKNVNNTVLQKGSERKVHDQGRTAISLGEMRATRRKELKIGS